MEIEVSVGENHKSSLGDKFGSVIPARYISILKDAMVSETMDNKFEKERLSWSYIVERNR